MITGVALTSAVTAGVTMAAIPAAVAVMSWIFLRETVAARTWAAIALAVLGISLNALSKPDTPSASQPLLGQLLLVAAVLCEATYAVIGKKLTTVLTPKRISAVINLWGLLLMTPMGLYTALQFNFSTVPANIWLLLVFYALAASVWTVWLWMTGLKVVPAARAGVFTVMLPVSAAVVGVLALGESLSALQAGAFAVALAGMFLATLPGRNTADKLPLN